jgi:molybdenum cofactor biosynthesis enzyme MoaA
LYANHIAPKIVLQGVALLSTPQDALQMLDSAVDSRLYHVTVLSNFARGFDKYSCTYAKERIAESTFPDRFFLLRREELSIGIEKAGHLLKKLGLRGNRLIALETRVPPTELRPNLLTGLGRYVVRPWIRLTDLHAVVGTAAEPQLQRLEIEEATALSLQLLQPMLHDYAALEPRTFSILPIARGCQAACPFCFSEASVSAVQEQSRLSLETIRDFALEARSRGAERFVITGGGEPGLVPHARLTQFIATGTSVLGKGVLITNGHHLSKLNEPALTATLRDYHAAGLRVLAISRHHHDDAQSAQLMSLRTSVDDIAHVWRCGRTDWPELQLRLTCVLQRGGIDDAAKLSAYMDWAAALGVREICFKELYVSTSIESVYHMFAANRWSREHQVPLSLVIDYARDHEFAEAARLPWGAPIFRGVVNGQPMQIAAYTEPSLFWERTNGIARSWNLMADGRCLASLEDRASEVATEAAV